MISRDTIFIISSIPSILSIGNDMALRNNYLTMARLVNLKESDIFEVIISDKEKTYFQYLCMDPLQLNSDVIRVFKQKYHLSDTPSINRITDDEVYFCVHVFLHKGVKEGYWKRIGNRADIGIIGNIVFKDVFSDLHRWRVHNLDGDCLFYYSLPKEYENAYIDGLFQPKTVFKMITLGPYSIHPNFYTMREDLYNEKECTERFGPWPHLGKLKTT